MSNVLLVLGILFALTGGVIGYNALERYRLLVGVVFLTIATGIVLVATILR